MSLILVERLEAETDQLKTQPLWLVWVGCQMPPLNEIWQQYLRRFAIEHWYRLAKQTLHWTIPQLSTPEQCQRWSDLMPLLTWQLWLAKDLVRETCLPWQKPLSQLTPGRVAQSMLPLLIKIGTPAVAPKPRGKSARWPPENLGLEDVGILWLKRVKVSSKIHQNSQVNLCLSLRATIGLTIFSPQH